MKSPKKPKVKPLTDDEKKNDYAFRLTDLEVELRRYPSLTTESAKLASVSEFREEKDAADVRVHFAYQKKSFSIGRADRTFADSSHARGVRRISLWLDGREVLGIEGDFENQEFGSNFRFKNVVAFTAGDWEKEFISLSDELAHAKAKRRLAFQKKRVADGLRG